MLLKKSLVLVLATLQISAFSLGLGSSAAWADTPPSPEASLLIATSKLQGEELSPSQLQSRLTTAFAQYNATAPATGRIQRLQDAIVSLHIDTPQQAHAIVQDAQIAGARLAGEPSLTEEQVGSEILALAQNSTGAQFSACRTSAYLGMAGIAILIGGLVANGVSPGNGATDTIFTGFWTMVAGGLVFILLAGPNCAIR